MDVVKKILKMRERLGLSQEEIEVRAGLPHNRVGKWEAGTGEPRASQLKGLSRALGVPIDWLCDDDAPDEPPATEPRGVVLSEGERIVLRLAREIGYEDAAARLMAHGTPQPEPERIVVRSTPENVVSPRRRRPRSG